MKQILILIAVVLFILASMAVQVGTFGLVPAGLACFAASFLARD